MKSESLDEIFGLNNEIGRLMKSRPELEAKLRELQFAVNAVTATIKGDDFAHLVPPSAAGFLGKENNVSDDYSR